MADDPVPSLATVAAPEAKKERKIYAGNVSTVGKMKADFKSPVPVQPIKRGIPGRSRDYQLPPTFVVTKFEPGFNSKALMHYVVPLTGVKGMRELGDDFELNVLSGKRGTEIAAEWETAKKTKLGTMVRRIGCTVGTDPEIFGVDAKGSVIPAWTYLGSKDNPDQYASLGGHHKGTTYWDGFQAEFTTPAGISCLAQMSDAVQAGLKSVYTALIAKNPKARLSIASVLPVSPKVLEKASEEHVAFGCAPSKNVYGLQGNVRDGRDVPYRFAGGHIHMGLEVKTEEYLRGLVRTMDSVLGVACVSMFATVDNPIRRQFYGLAGEYRTPPHGLEYRVLSNAWLSHPLMMHMVFDLARAAAGMANDGFSSVWNATEKETVDTINNHDVDKAREILSRNVTVFRALLHTIGGGYINEAAKDIAVKVWSNGVESAVASPGDIEDNWNLKNTWVSHSEGVNKYFARACQVLGAGGKV